MNRARFDARKSGDQIFWLDPPEAARLARIKTGNLAPTGVKASRRFRPLSLPKSIKIAPVYEYTS